MTVGELMCELERLRPGSVMSLNDCFSEINRAALDIFENILSQYEAGADFEKYTDEAQTLDIPENYAELYKYRLLAKIDMNNGDITRYTNNMLLYNNLMSEYGDWYNRSHMHKQKAKLRWR